MIRITLDTTALSEWAKTTAKAVQQAETSVVNKAMGRARNAALAAWAVDADFKLGGGFAKIRERETRQDNAGKTVVRPFSRASGRGDEVSATWTVSNRNTPNIISTKDVQWQRNSPLRADTFVKTGGASHPLTAPRSWIMKANGATFVAHRVGGKIRGIFAEGLKSAMQSDERYAAQVFVKEAENALNELMPAAIEAAFKETTQ